MTMQGASVLLFYTTSVVSVVWNSIQTPHCTVYCSTGKLFKSKTHVLEKCRKLNAVPHISIRRVRAVESIFPVSGKLSRVTFNMHIFIGVHTVYGFHRTDDNYAWNSRRNKQKLNNAPAVEQHFSGSCFIVRHVCCSVC